MSTQRYEAAGYTSQSGQGAAVGSDPPLERISTQPAAAFEEYVLTYSRAQRWNVGLVFAGIGVAVGAAMYLSGALLIAAAAVGLGLTGGGVTGFLIAAEAHAAYTRYLSVNITRTFAEPPQPRPAVRPFVPSSDGPATIRAGRFTLPADTWSAVFAQAEANGGRLTRDGATKVLPRAMYRDWQTTLGELQRLGLFDNDGRVTTAGWEFARRNVNPPSLPADAHAGAHSTRARRTHDAHGAGGE